jgi:protein-disulfide isomerase
MALVVMGVLIAGAILIKAPSPSTGTAKLGNVPTEQVAPETNLDAMIPVTSADHIRGNPNAPVKIVEYSDTECPFCKRFHTTMQEVMKEYGDNGNVAWVYRHFPLDSLHSKARKEAEATECAGELGGNDKFWAYLDRLMEVTPANNGLDLAELPKIASYVGLDTAKFNECLSGGKYAQKIEEHVQNAQATGGQGTPWSIVVSKSGKKYPLSGAQPISAIKQLVDIALKDK